MRRAGLGETLIENPPIHRLTFVPLEALYALVTPPRAGHATSYDGPRRDAAQYQLEEGGVEPDSGRMKSGAPAS